MLMERMWGPFLTLLWLGDSFELFIFPSLSFLHVSSTVLAVTHKVTGIKDTLLKDAGVFLPLLDQNNLTRAILSPVPVYINAVWTSWSRKPLLVQTRSWFNNLILVDLTFLTVQC